MSRYILNPFDTSPPDQRITKVRMFDGEQPSFILVCFQESVSPDEASNRRRELGWGGPQDNAEGWWLLKPIAYRREAGPETTSSCAVPSTFEVAKPHHVRSEKDTGPKILVELSSHHP